MLRRKEAFTVVTPIPGFIPRQLALDILHSHSEVITLNPLVLEHRPIPAPRTAAADEFYSTWYEIVERIQYVPGVGKVGSGRITFTACFHDMPWGLQTHIYAPLNIDLRSRYHVAGNQPGTEPPEPREIGLAALGAPADGLYLREDIELKCNIAMVAFVRAQLRAASSEMVQRIIKKAELLDAGVLYAMMEDGRLKTINPNDRSRPALDHSSVSPGHGPLPSPPLSARPDAAYDWHHWSDGPVELPGDCSPGTQHPTSSWQGLQPQWHPSSDAPSPGFRGSTSSSDPRWSQGRLSPSLADTHRTSASSMASGSGHPSPGYSRQGLAIELAAHKDTNERRGPRAGV